MIEITGITLTVSIFYIICKKFLKNLDIILLSIIFFPFLFKDKTGYLFYFNFKDIYLILLSILLYFIFLIPAYKKDNQLLKYFYILNFILLFVPIINFFYNYDYIVISSTFKLEFFKSILIPVCYSIIFFTILAYYNKLNIENLFKKFNFILVIIFFEFLISLIIKNYIDLEILKQIYPDNIFRSIFINGHIATQHFFIFGYFLGFYFYKSSNEKKYLIFNLMFFLIIIYNLESRLTIGAFLFTNLILLYYFLKNKFINEKKVAAYSLLYGFLLFLFIKIILNFFSFSITSIQPQQEKLFFFIFDFWPTPLIERINTNIFFLESLVSNSFFGFGFDNVGSFTSINNLELIKKIFVNDFDQLSYSLLHGDNSFLNFHGSIPRVHSGILNLFVSYGLFFIFFIYLFLKILDEVNYDFKNLCLLKNYILITCIFFICSSLMNYIYEVEFLVILLISSYIILGRNYEA